MLPLALALSVLQPPAQSGDIGVANREAVRAALSRGQAAVDRIGRCMTVRPAPDGIEHHYDGLLDSLREIGDRAEELRPGLNPVSEFIPASETAGAPACDAASIRALDQEARDAIGEARTLVQADEARRSNGLWLGPLRLCGDRVESIADEEPEFAGDSRRVIVRFSTGFAPRVRALTEALVNRRLSVVLDGTTVVRATVMEPISWSISIATPDALPTNQFRRAVAMPC